MTVTSLRWTFVVLAVACGWTARFVTASVHATLFYYAIGSLVMAPIVFAAAVMLPSLLRKGSSLLIVIVAAYGALNLAYVGVRVARRPPGAPFTTEDVTWIGISILVVIVLITNIRRLAARESDPTQRSG